MRLLFLLLLLTSAHYLRAQEVPRGDGAWGEWAAGFQHSAAFLSPAGDSMNQINAQGWYHGPHVYTRYATPRFSDTTDYILGRFDNGQPVGDWTLHYRDGRYATGPYNARPEGKAKQGIFNKIGLWRFYDASGRLLKTLRYHRVPGRLSTYLLSERGMFVLVWNYHGTKEKIYFNGGSRQMIKRDSWRGYRCREWYPNGQLRSVVRYRGLERYINCRIEKRRDYYADGQIQRRFRGLGMFRYWINTSTNIEYTPTGEISRVRKRPLVDQTHLVGF
jgi:hypothetical protein